MDRWDSVRQWRESVARTERNCDAGPEIRSGTVIVDEPRNPHGTAMVSWSGCDLCRDLPGPFSEVALSLHLSRRSNENDFLGTGTFAGDTMGDTLNHTKMFQFAADQNLT